MNDIYTTWNKRAAARGLRPSTARYCLRPVARLHCLKWGNHRYEGCPGCPPGIGLGGFSGLWDHPRMWLDAGRERVLTLEPYGLDAQELEILEDAADELDLTVTVEPPERSFWNPGRTHLITIRRAA